MNLRILNIGFALFAFTLLAGSCVEEVVDVDMPSSKPTLVVYCFITANDTINVDVFQSIPYFSARPNGYNNAPIVNANVFISDEYGNQALISYISKKNRYSLAPSSFTVEEGKTYRLSVSAPGFDPVTASTTMPNYIPTINHVYVDTVRSMDNLGYSYDLLVGGKILDQPNANNYYRVKIFIDSYGYTFNYSDGSIDSEFFTDKRSVDGIIPFNQRIGFTSWDTISIFVINSDYGYYTYHRSLYSFEPGNPFVEPTPVYSNINGGLGVFGSYLLRKVIIKPID